MWVFLLLYATLVCRYFLVAQTSFLQRRLPRMKPLQSRQAPGVIAASEFLRRGYQTCKFRMQSSDTTLKFTV